MSVSGHEYSFVSDYWQVMTDDKEIALPADPNDPEDRPVSKSGLVMAHRGRKLRLARTGLGLSQETFSGLLGVSSVELQAWEQVRQKIPEDLFAKLLDIKAN
jgi:putative transcriptional regulator